MPVRALPHCAAHAPCGVIVERPPRGRPGYRRPCMRRARFVVECPGRPLVLACPRHVQMAAMHRVWSGGARPVPVEAERAYAP